MQRLLLARRELFCRTCARISRLYVCSGARSSIFTSRRMQNRFALALVANVYICVCASLSPPLGYQGRGNWTSRCCLLNAINVGRHRERAAITRERERETVLSIGSVRDRERVYMYMRYMYIYVSIARATAFNSGTSCGFAVAPTRIEPTRPIDYPLFCLGYSLSLAVA